MILHTRVKSINRQAGRLRYATQRGPRLSLMLLRARNSISESRGPRCVAYRRRPACLLIDFTRVWRIMQAGRLRYATTLHHELVDGEIDAVPRTPHCELPRRGVP